MVTVLIFTLFCFFHGIVESWSLLTHVKGESTLYTNESIIFWKLLAAQLPQETKKFLIKNTP